MRGVLVHAVEGARASPRVHAFGFRVCRGSPRVGGLFAKLLSRAVGTRLRIGGRSLVTRGAGTFEVTLGARSVPQGAPCGGGTRVESGAVGVDSRAVSTMVGDAAAGSV